MHTFTHLLKGLVHHNEVSIQTGVWLPRDPRSWCLVCKSAESPTLHINWAPSYTRILITAKFDVVSLTWQLTTCWHPRALKVVWPAETSIVCMTCGSWRACRRGWSGTGHYWPTTHSCCCCLYNLQTYNTLLTTCSWYSYILLSFLFFLLYILFSS